MAERLGDDGRCVSLRFLVPLAERVCDCARQTLALAFSPMRASGLLRGARVGSAAQPANQLPYATGEACEFSPWRARARARMHNKPKEFE